VRALRLRHVHGDKNGRKVPVLNSLASVLGIENDLKQYGYTISQAKDFERFYSDIYGQERLVPLRKTIEQKVFEYFLQLKLPNEVNLYDHLILSLTQKDLIISFNWDPFLLQAYLRNIDVGDLPQIVFPHGNVGMGLCNKCKLKGYYGYVCNSCFQEYQRSPLLFPVDQKNYNDISIIRNEWKLAKNYLQMTWGITIFGYSAPETDIESIELMKESFEQSRTKVYAPVTIINLPSEKQDQLTKWKEFYDDSNVLFCRAFEETDLWRYPRISLEAFFNAVLQQDPKPDTFAFVGITSLAELQKTAKSINTSFPLPE
jgi:hypothetical protein